jgi:hypothetical protein
MKGSFTGADIVWARIRDGATYVWDSHGIMLPLPRDEPIHVSFSALRWDPKTFRYLLVGGIVLRFNSTDTDPYFPGECERNLPSNKHCVSIIKKTNDSAQWHEGTITTIDSCVLSFCGWPGTDVSYMYENAAFKIIQEIETKTNTVFRGNEKHWDNQFDERGFIRQSELRVCVYT